jgi:diguanylate cyclase (GGDEF)-like protein
VEKRETSGVTIRLIIEYVRANLGDGGVARLLAAAGESRSVEELENARNWSTYEQRIALFEAAAAVTGDPAVARKIGAWILHSKGTALLRSLLLPFRSPRSLLKALPVVHSKFDAAGESQILELEAESARVAYRVKPPRVASRHDCLYTEGLLTQVSALFGLPPAKVAHRACQSEGAPHCLLTVSWRAKRWRRGDPIEDRDDEAAFARLQLEQLQETLAELMWLDDPDKVLRRIVHHAGSSVAAQRLVFVTRDVDGGVARVNAEGFSDDEAAEVAADLDAGRPVALAEGQHVLSSPVRSAHRDYGLIVAVSTGPFAETEQALLDSYGRLAAVTLDTRAALEEARLRSRIAEVFAAFARHLIGVRDLAELSRATVSAALDITGADRASLLVHDEETGTLSTLGRAGSYPEGSLADGQIVHSADTPELSSLLGSPDHPRYYDRSHGDEYVVSALHRFGLHAMAVVTLRSGERVLGVLVASFDESRTELPRVDDDFFARLAGIADQAAGAWEKALLSEQVQRQASLDPLTGLANRRVFTELLAELLSRPDDHRSAVLFCDLDDFKKVNDALGHAAGDDLLLAVSRRLQHCVRSDDLVARLGGDEFTVLLRDVEGAWTPDAFADKVRSVMAEPIEIEGSRVHVHLSIGAVVATPGESTVKDVLRRADAAMYVAKTQGGNRLLMFEEAMLLERSERAELETSLAQALREPEQLPVLYQPQVDLASGRFVAAEALVRWDHPRRGRLTPDQFLPVAEASGFVVAIDFHVLRTAIAQAAYWRSVGIELRVSVNLSGATLADPQLLQEVRAALEESALPGVLLEIEFQEGAAAAEPAALTATLLELSDLGISIAVDDVGADHSSLSLLHRLPAHRIKIDRSFVSQLPADQASASVVEAVVLLARRLGQSVIAEGIETTEQARCLHSLGCEIGQGFLYSRPIAADELTLAVRRSEQVSA